jgi:hypothetical protein
MRELKEIIDRIEEFDRQTSAAEHTDTGDAWDLLRIIKKRAQEAQEAVAALKEAKRLLADLLELKSEEWRYHPDCEKYEEIVLDFENAWQKLFGLDPKWGKAEDA